MRKVLYIFGLLTDADIEWMVGAGAQHWYKPGDIVITEGKQTDAIVLLLKGEFIVTAKGAGELARLGVGEIVGEMSLVDSAPPSATVTASGECYALLLDKAALLDKLEADAPFGRRFYHALAIFLADRLRAMRGMVPKGERSLANDGVAKDERDSNILDNISAAGDRFHRMLRMLADQT
jgi:CRP/FNR family transcriptional regulator, cyclic AMP receptor protein